MTTSAKLLAAAVLSAISAGCSLEYEKERNPEATTPEFVFRKARFSRVEEGATTMRMSADKIEQYKADGVSVAKNAEFRTFDREGNAETECSCERVSADTRGEVYVLLGAIEMNMIPQNMSISAESLRFDRKNEQITSGTEQPVTIHRDDADITGVGFSASGVSRTFSFARSVSGTIETKEDGEAANGEAADGRKAK